MQGVANWLEALPPWWIGLIMFIVFAANLAVPTALLARFGGQVISESAAWGSFGAAVGKCATFIASQISRPAGAHSIFPRLSLYKDLYQRTHAQQKIVSSAAECWILASVL